MRRILVAFVLFLLAMIVVDLGNRVAELEVQVEKAEAPE